MSLYNFSTNLKNLRLSKNLTQKQLSDVLNVSRQTISNYENSTNEPDFYMIAKIANYFNCSIDSLVFGGLNTSLQNIDNLLDISKILINKNTLTKQLIDNKALLYKNIEEIDKIIFVLNSLNSNNLDIPTSNNFNEYKNNNSIDIDFYKNNNLKICDSLYSKFRHSNQEQLSDIPFYRNISCGALKYTNESIEDYFYLHKNDLKYDKSDYFILQIDGESMNKLYKNGDYILIHKTKNYEGYKPYVFILDDEATLKYIDIDLENRNIILVPHSTYSCYQNQILKFEDLNSTNFGILGTVEGILNFID